MRLIRLRLENFRQHQDTEIEFSDGMTAIVGANGTGKTTVLEGITFALYGEQRDNKETVRFYWSDKRKFSSTLEFDFNGERYEVHRSNTDASFSKFTDGLASVVATGQVEVRKASERLLGLSYDQFKNSFCAEQKELTFLNFSNSAKQDEVARMLGFDRLKLAEAEARERCRTFKASAEILERTLGDPAQLKRERDQAAAELKQILNGIEANRKKLEDLHKALGPAQEKRKAAEAWRKFDLEMRELGGNAKGLKDNVATTEAALKEIEAQVNELSTIEPREQEYRRLEKELKEWERKRELDREREKSAAEIEHLKADIARLTEELKQAKAVDLGHVDKLALAAKENLQRAQTELKAQEQTWAHLRTYAEKALATADANYQAAKKAFDRAREMIAKGQCPGCGQALGENYRTNTQKLQREMEDCHKLLEVACQSRSSASEKPVSLASAEESERKAVEELQKVTLEREQAIKDAAHLKLLNEDKTKKSERLSVLEAKLAQTPSLFSSEKFDRVKKGLTDLEDAHRRFLALEDCRSKLPLRQKEHELARAALDEAKSKYRQAEQERAKLPFNSEDEVTKAIAGHQALETERSVLENELKNGSRSEQMQQKMLEQAEARIKEYEERSKELEAAKLSALLHDTAARELRALRESLNRSIGPDLAARASENLSLLTNGRYSQLELDKNFEPSVMEDSVRKDVISGGEEDVVALALRLALSELIQERNGRPMSLLVLDEVFGGLDLERRHSVMERLAALKGRFQQILVISHIEEINQVADHAIFLRRDPESRATLITDVPPESSAVLL